jgi:hypothetical protein
LDGEMPKWMIPLKESIKISIVTMALTKARRKKGWCGCEKK